MSQNTATQKPAQKTFNNGNKPQQNQPRRGSALTTTRRQEPLVNNPLGTPALQAHLRSLKRAEYKNKSREELSPSHNFQTRLRDIRHIGRPGLDHINTARWTEDDLSTVFSLANPIPFHFEPFDTKITSMFHMYAFLFSGARQVLHLMTSNASSLDSLVRGKPAVVTNRFAIFAYAVYCKIAQNPDLTAVAQSTTAPFDYYIVKRSQTNPGSMVRSRIYESAVIAGAFEEARKAVIKGEFPNLVPFFDLDYQLDLEEITNKAERVERMKALLEEACAPIREKIKNLESKKTAPKKAADASAKQQPTPASESNTGAEAVAQAPAEDAGLFNQLVYKGEPAPSQTAADAESGIALEQAVQSAQPTTAAATETPVSTSANTDPSDLASGAKEETVLVLDGFAPATTLTTVGQN